MTKAILGRYGNNRGHWVGDGFPVRSLFSYNNLGQHISPFLLLDYAGPHDFAPTTDRRGVGQHPHRGFETVTIVYDGEVEHRDSAGNGGIIGPGDVQWMTAAGGILHEEYHSPAFAKTGGRFRMVQLWVNLPAKDKMAPGGYQGIVAADIPAVDLPDNAGTARVIVQLRGFLRPCFGKVMVRRSRICSPKPASGSPLMKISGLETVAPGAASSAAFATDSHHEIPYASIASRARSKALRG